MYWYILRAGPAIDELAHGQSIAPKHWVAKLESSNKVDPFFTNELTHDESYSAKRAKRIVRWALINMGKVNKQHATELVSNGFWPDERISHGELCVKIYTDLSRRSNRKGTVLVRCLKQVGSHDQVVLTDRSWEYGE